jgi:hypothetical protein
LVDTLRTLEPPWTEVRAICRRICLLRSQGRQTEAQRVEEAELAAAAAQAEDSDAGPLAEARVKALMAEEAERVAAAIAFADLLAPMLAERLGALAPLRERAAANPRPDVPRPGPAGESRGIADFIDEMLAQDRAGSR